MFTKIKNTISVKKIGLTSALVLVGVSSALAGPAADIAAGVDFTDVATAIGTIGGLLAVVYAGYKGAKIVLGMIRGA